MKQLIGPAIMLLSTTAVASLWPLFKKANQTSPPFTVMTITMLTLFATSLILSLIFDHTINLKYLTTHKNTILILVAAGLINALAFWLIIKAFKYMPIWQQSMFNLLVPILSSIFAYFILGEAISIRLFLGLVIMGLGLFIAVR